MKHSGVGELKFTVEGVLVSTNHAYANGDSGRHLTSKGREDKARVRCLAELAVLRVGWIIPAAASVQIDAYNCGKDVGNIEKIPVDALKGVVIRDDQDVMALRVERLWDDAGPRYVLTVTAVEDRRPIPGPAARRRARRGKVSAAVGGASHGERVASPQAKYQGGPIPAGMALLGNELIPAAEAVRLLNLDESGVRARASSARSR